MAVMWRLLPLILPLFLTAAGCDPLVVESFGQCGDGARNTGEECDQGVDNSSFEPDTCRTDCTRPRCGDGVKDSGEDCDLAQTGGLACEDLGFDRGILQCDDQCRFDLRLCSTCGNGLAEPGEACDLGDLGGITCVGAGFSGGTLRCHLNCEYDYSLCSGGCGNGILENDEDCDSETVPEPECSAIGFTSGMVSCDRFCHLDLTGCEGGCGNGRVEVGETCDDGNFTDRDGCVGCREPSGTYEIYLEMDMPELVSDADIADLDGDGIPDLLFAVISEDLASGALFWTSGAESHTITHTLIEGPFLFARAVRRPGGSLALLGVSLAPDGTALFHWAVGLDSPFSVLAGPDRPVDLLAADLDGDDGEEIVFSAFQSQNLILFDPIAGTFTGINAMGGLPQAIGRIDFNQDGAWDLVVARGTSQLLSMIQQVAGAWTYTSARYLGGRPGDVAVADVDGDGVDDVLVTDLSGPRLYALRTVSGTLTTRVELVLPSSAARIDAGRIDADGITDLLLTLPDEKAVAVFSGSGNWSFSRLFTYGPCETPDWARLYDMDADGFLDLVFSCRHDRRMVVLRTVPR